jgi:membrane protein implicated in regulation of membrane protease activity
MELYWIWFGAGVLMILIELGMPGFVICFFGISALAAGFAKFFFPSFPLIGQLLLFAVGGAALALSCRKIAPGIFAGKESRKDEDIDSDDIVDSVCICREDINGDVAGKVEFRGSLWSAKADEVISAGEYCVVKERNNLTLKVRRK